LYASGIEKTDITHFKSKTYISHFKRKRDTAELIAIGAGRGT
jgi:hypothetical protein